MKKAQKRQVKRAKKAPKAAKRQTHTEKVRVRLYKPEASIGKAVRLDQEQIRHLKVLKIQEDEPIRLFDGKGREFDAFFTGKVRDGTVKVEREIQRKNEPAVAVTLAIAMPKGGRADILVEKVSEIGVKHIVPIITARSVVKPKEGKIQRWRKIAIEACGQSERCVVPLIEEPTPFGELLGTIKRYNQAYLCHPGGTPLAKAYTSTASVLLIVGPEGGFTETELQAAEEAGCAKVSLGPTVLRVETASIAAATQIIGLSRKSL